MVRSNALAPRSTHPAHNGLANPVKRLCFATYLGVVCSIAGCSLADAQEKVTAKAAESALPAKEVIACRKPNSEGQFVVHEWGTFTTFSGSDGIFLDFRPLAEEHNDLPDYVLDRANFSRAGVFAKSRIRGRVRMETPVTYFYTDRIRTVEVSVDFPQGLLTEFYPPVRQIKPPLNEKLAFTDGEPIGNSSLNWGKVDLIPVDALVPGIQDSKLRHSIAQQLIHNAVPHGPNEHHYAHARAVDAALVHTRPVESHPFMSLPRRDSFERFLFYRGVGSFELPVSVSFDEQAPTFTNRGELPIRSAILIESRSGHIRATKIDEIGAGGQEVFRTTEEMTVEELGELVEQSLEAEGLYRKEAQSMVNTWKDSWFTEEGRRVLYIVPQEVTDELLPLHIQPAPQQQLRVLVGRMEIMSPKDEARLTKHVRQSISGRAEFAKKHDLKKEQYPIPAPILTWGRMTEPALVRIAKSADDINVQREAENLLASLRADNG